MGHLKALVLSLGVSVLLEPTIAWALKPSVAVAPIKGRKRARPQKLARGIQFGLKATGIRVISAKTVRKVAKDSGVAADSADAAEAVGAGFLVVVKLKRQRKRTVAVAELIRAKDGSVVKKATRRYRNARGALRAGKAIGKLFGKVAKKSAASAPVAKAEPPGEPTIVAPPPPPPPAVKIKPKKSSPTKTKTELARPKAGSNPENKVFRLSVGSGTQVGSAYTVAVGGDVTGLAYNLNPLFMISGAIDLFFADLGPGGLGIHASTSFVPVTYAIDVDPPVDPAEPSGRFFNVGGGVRYRFDIAEWGESGRFFATPLLGVNYHLLSVEDQGENTIVVSWAAINLTAGAQVGAQVSDAFTIAIEGRVGGVLSYDEAPVTTGNSGKGLTTSIGGQARFWISQYLGVFLQGVYQFQRVGMSGDGNRVRFTDDPPLTDATVFSADFKVGAGVMLAL